MSEAEKVKAPIYTIIAYRPNGEDSFRGFTESRTDSKLRVYTSLDRQDIIDIWVECLFKDYKLEYKLARGVSDWEIRVLLDGREADVSYNDEMDEDQFDYGPADARQLLLTEIEEEVKVKFNALVETDKVAEAAKIAAEKAKTNDAERAAKLAQLERLQRELFGGESKEKA